MPFSDVVAGLYARIDPQPPGRSPSVWRVREALRVARFKQPSAPRLYAWANREKPVMIPVCRLADLCDAAGMTVAERNALVLEWAEEARRVDKPPAKADALEVRDV